MAERGDSLTHTMEFRYPVTPGTVSPGSLTALEILIRGYDIELNRVN